jgi:hypothetical protein
MTKHIPISIGEYIDKITILELKLANIQNASQLQNVKKELDLLLNLDNDLIVGTEKYTKLKTINEQLWIVEEQLRIKETQQDFNKDFIELARSVYKLNDERAAIKKEINLMYNSELVEEKSYD